MKWVAQFSPVSERYHAGLLPDGCCLEAYEEPAQFYLSVRDIKKIASMRLNPMIVVLMGEACPLYTLPKGHTFEDAAV